MIVQRIFSAIVFTALCVAPAVAKPTVIAELGTAPLLGTSTSTLEMRERVAHNEDIMSAAAVRVGLTAGEYAQFHTAIAESHVAWVIVPRHLDVMTWQSGGHVYALHNVIIPKNTYGWEVDVNAHGQVLALYMPAKCGNLSVVRKPRSRAGPPRCCAGSGRAERSGRRSARTGRSRLRSAGTARRRRRADRSGSNGVSAGPGSRRIAFPSVVLSAIAGRIGRIGSRQRQRSGLDRSGRMPVG